MIDPAHGALLDAAWARGEPLATAVTATRHFLDGLAAAEQTAWRLVVGDDHVECWRERDDVRLVVDFRPDGRAHLTRFSDGNLVADGEVHAFAEGRRPPRELVVSEWSVGVDEAVTLLGRV